MEHGKIVNRKRIGTRHNAEKRWSYQARFTNRFGKRQTIYGKTINEIRQKLRAEQYEYEKQINTIVSKDSKPEEPRVLTIEEADLFLEAASHYRYFNAFSLALETGMRIGEIIGLKWSDIDFANRTIYVNRTLVYIKSDDENSPNYNKWGFEFHEPKTDKGRRKIPMTLKAYQILKRQQLWKRGMETKDYKASEGYEDLVFTTTKNTPISPRDTIVVMKFITERIRKKRPDFEPVTPHTLRHTFATRCIERRMNPKTLQIILGHSTIQLTMNLYCHVTDDMLVSEMSKFENGANENPEGVIPINGVKVV